MPLAQAHPSGSTFRLRPSFFPGPPFHAIVLEVRQIVNLTAILILPAVHARTVKKPLLRPDGFNGSLPGAHDNKLLCHAHNIGRRHEPQLLDAIMLETVSEYHRKSDPVVKTREGDRMVKLSTPGEILSTALAKEKAAYRFYERIETQTRIDYVADLLRRLKDEEAKHVKLIENMLVNMNLGRGG